MSCGSRDPKGYRDISVWTLFPGSLSCEQALAHTAPTPLTLLIIIMATFSKSVTGFTLKGRTAGRSERAVGEKAGNSHKSNCTDTDRPQPESLA